MNKLNIFDYARIARTHENLFPQFKNKVLKIIGIYIHKCDDEKPYIYYSLETNEGEVYDYVRQDYLVKMIII